MKKWEFTAGALPGRHDAAAAAAAWLFLSERALNQPPRNEIVQCSGGGA
ncbi:MAG TPA: hypothetical protein VN792_07530 [Candidatus Acidoferrales bacterium]|nr:hypothetical protein [Candidatus Acidoferrales bacterium]